MSSRVKRKSNYNYTADDFAKAVIEVSEKRLSYGKAFKKYGVPCSTIRDKIINRPRMHQGIPRPSTLNDSEEASVVIFIKKKVGKLGYGKTKHEFVKIVKEILSNDRRIMSKVFKEILPSIGWVWRFLTQHPELASLRAKKVNPGSSDTATQHVAKKKSCQKRTCEMPEDQEPQKKICRQSEMLEDQEPQKKICRQSEMTEDQEPQKKICRQSEMPENQELQKKICRQSKMLEDQEPQKKICQQTSDHYTLQHNNHQTLVLESLAQDEMFMDLTLTSQGRAIKAHKSVLSAMSPYFRRVLNDNPCQHPIIVMPRDILFDELKNLITYIYKGEVTVPFDGVSSLLKTAHTLEIAGLNELKSENAKNMYTPLSQDHSSQATEERLRGPSGTPDRMIPKGEASTSASSNLQEQSDEANFVKEEFLEDWDEFLEDWEGFPSNEPLTMSKAVSCGSSGPPWPSSQTEEGDARRIRPPTKSPRSSPPPLPNLMEDDKTASDNEDSCTILSPSKIHPFVCCFCTQSYHSVEHLRSHLNLRHELLDWFLCECGVVVADESLLHTHKREYCNHPVAQSHK